MPHLYRKGPFPGRGERRRRCAADMEEALGPGIEAGEVGEVERPGIVQRDAGAGEVRWPQPLRTPGPKIAVAPQRPGHGAFARVAGVAVDLVGRQVMEG